MPANPLYKGLAHLKRETTNQLFMLFCEQHLHLGTARITLTLIALRYAFLTLGA
jgi:hypothetical protein